MTRYEQILADHAADPQKWAYFEQQGYIPPTCLIRARLVAAYYEVYAECGVKAQAIREAGKLHGYRNRNTIRTAIRELS